jgi:hypothetical protein
VGNNTSTEKLETFTTPAQPLKDLLETIEIRPSTALPF